MVHVRFNGMTLWFTGTLQELQHGDGALAPEEHVTDGELNTLWGEHSYAHLFDDGVIRRYNEPIGKRSDLEVLDAS